MSNVIDFLERLGRDAGLRHAPRAVLESAMQSERIDAEVRAALLKGDQPRLEELLGADANVCCAIHVPLPGGQEDDKSKPKDDKKVAA
jgi:hypothetical protein